MIAPMVANMTKKNIKFMILMAGPGTAIDRLVKQNYLGELTGMPEESLQENKKSNQKNYAFIKKI
jgi:carbon monoxide dehydrogenase subunit G